MFSISFPGGCRNERRWISHVLFHEFLGVEHEVRFDAQECIRISAEGKTLELDDVFFRNAADHWLSPTTLPVRPLRNWFVPDSGLAPDLIEPIVPVIFGRPGFEMGKDRVTLGVDVFGAAFFMLSRYEEAVIGQRDQHDRFPAGASLAYLEGFLERPLIDEYVEILWAAMERLWPQAGRRQHQYRTVVSCDVDIPYHPGARSFLHMVRAAGRQMVRTRNPMAMLGPYRNFLGGRHGDLQHDPYYFTVDWMMDVNERTDNTVAFNFIPETTDPVYDGVFPIDDPAVVAMMKRISQRRHEIGIHPGYLAYQSAKDTLSGLEKLQNVMHDAQIEQPVSSGRLHYLRWSTKTPAIWESAGLRYDSTLGYADRVGFRCGTCREYSMFDLHQRRPLELKQIPLLCMDCTITSYMGYGLSCAGLEKMNELKRTVKKMKGNFSLLWHNTSLESPEARDIYREVINHAL